MEKRKLFVFDLDDTIRYCVQDYADAILTAPKIIVKALGPKAPHVRTIIDLAAEIDHRRIHEINPTTGELFYYSMERFPGSCVETYREICNKLGVNPDSAVEKLLWEMGMTAFDESLYRQNIHPHAKEVLDFLIEQGDCLVLLTKGDSQVQKRKIKALKAEGIDHFTMILITKWSKTPQTFQNIHRNHLSDLSPISVGNSYDSDIVPALEAGYFGIYIPLETWEELGKMEEIKARVDRSRCLILSDLSKIITEYGRLP